MIDIDSEVYSAVSSAVLAEYPSAFVVGRETRTPSRFPCISIVESDNYTYMRTQDSGSTENHAVIMYTLTAYSNKANGGKSECRGILAAADSAMLRLGFSKTRARPLSLDDATKYRIIARYEAVVGKDNKIYRR